MGFGAAILRIYSTDIELTCSGVNPLTELLPSLLCLCLSNIDTWLTGVAAGNGFRFLGGELFLADVEVLAAGLRVLIFSLRVEVNGQASK